MTISFRRYEGSSGMIKKLYEEFKHREETSGTAYARRYPSYVFNNKPGLEEALREFKETKPEEYACMIDSTDSEGSFDSFIKDAARIKTSMSSERSWIFDFPIPPDNWQNIGDSEFSYEKDGERVYLDPYDIPVKCRGTPGERYVLGVDPGLGNVNAGGDSLGITLAHRKIVVKDGKKWVRPVIDFSFRLTGRMFPEGEIQFLAVQNLITKLNNLGYRIDVYTMDSWNSASLSQWIKREYPKATVIANSKAEGGLVTTKDFNSLRDAIFSEAPPSGGQGDVSAGGGIDWFWHPILYWEIKELVIDRTKSPSKVDHKKHTSKDMTDPLAKVISILNSLPIDSGVIFADDKGILDNEKNSAERKRLEMRKKEEERIKSHKEMVSSIAGLGKFRRAEN